MNMPADFIQPAVHLGNTYRGDRVLQSWLASELPPQSLRIWMNSAHMRQVHGATRAGAPPSCRH